MILILAIVFRKLHSSGTSLPVTAEWIDGLSLESYRPMVRLLDDQDIQFLRAQPGFTPAMAAKHRIQRSRIFRAYLDRLSGDFGRVSTALKLIMLHSGLDRPDLASVLLHHQLMFATGMICIQIRLFFYRWGIGTVDAASLVRLFDLMRLELRSLVPVTEPAGA